MDSPDTCNNASRAGKDSLLMGKLSTFISEGEFFKGNLHCHSTFSDGSWTVQKLKDEYKAKGYNFVAFTDHNFYANWKELNEEGFMALQGFEANLAMDGEGREFHFVAIPGGPAALANASKPFFSHKEKVPVRQFKGLETAQELIDDLISRGYQVIFAHPHWSTVEYDDVLKLKGIVACEVYNHCSAWLENMGESSVFWDALLRRDFRLWGVASDDNHNRYPSGSAYCDSFGGFVQVKAKSLSEKDICESISKGSFYASSGPAINDFYVEDGEAFISCSPVKRIYFNGDRRNSMVKIAEAGEAVTEMRTEVYSVQNYIRAEIYDEFGRKAYTNPIFLK
jgi:hypothetical protein